MEVEVEIEEIDIENEDGRMQAGVKAICSECGHETESYGTSERSRRRCLVMLKEECPRNENNFYVDPEGS